MRRLRETRTDRALAALRRALLAAERGAWRLVLCCRLHRDPGLGYTWRRAWRSAGRQA